MLTIFATPRAFAGEFDVIQRNAIASWIRLQPRPQVVLMGNEAGTAAVCEQLGVEHVPDVLVSELGTPFADSMLALAEERAVHPLLLWIAADTILCNDVMPAVVEVSRRFQRFCMIAGRYRLPRPSPLDFDDPGWEVKLRASVIGPLLEDVCAVDFFVFPKYFWGRFPPFIEGRMALDGWMLFRTLETGGALVDATPVVTTIHQDHSYARDPGGAAAKLSGPEVRYNVKLASKRMLTRDNADWILTADGLRRPPHSFRRHVAWCARYAAFFPRAGWPLRAYRFLMERLVLAPAAARADALARRRADLI
jgi:hypothetical protein